MPNKDYIFQDIIDFGLIIILMVWILTLGGFCGS